MKRKILAGFALLLSGTLVACSSAPTDPAPEPSSNAPSDSPDAPQGASACEGVTLNFIGLEGEEGKAELEGWRAERSSQLASSWPGDWSQLIAAIKVGQPFDMSTIPYHWAQRMIAADVVQPIDVSRLSNWEKIAPGLRESPSLRGADGAVYGVPIAWGDAPFVYAPDRVAEPPASIKDMLDPSWKGRFVLFDAPDFPFHLLAKANGFEESPLLTQEQLDIVAAEAKTLVENAGAFNSNYQDATDRLINKDIDLAIGGWEAQLTWAEEKGVALDFGFFDEGKHGWWDGLAIPTTAENVDCTYEYIDQMIAAETQAEIATNLVSGAVNVDAFDLVGEEAQIYDYSVVTGEANESDFASSTPPEEVPEGFVNYQAWLDAWQAIKS